MVSNIQVRKRKTEVLTKSETTSLRKYVNTFHTVIDAAYAIGIHRNVLDRVLIVGKGSPDTVNSIRAKLAEVETKEDGERA